MLRILSAIAISMALACAFLLYTVSYDARLLASTVQSQERRIERLHSDIAVMKAELAYLARPERIEPLARALGFLPAAGEQYMRPEPVKAETIAAETEREPVDGSATPAQSRPSR